MNTASPPHALHFFLLMFSGWVNRQQQQAIDYLLEENRILRQQLGGRRLRLSDDQRRRLAMKVRLLGRKVLVAANLATREMRFGLSEGMVLAAGPGGKDIHLVEADEGALAGDRVR